MSSLFITWLWRDPYFFFCTAFFVIFSVCCHEFMHVYAALKAGDPAAADSGHLTLNPLKQMGVWSLLLFAFFGLAWGAVPVKPGTRYRLRHGAALTAAAGPLTNLMLSILFLILVIVCMRFGAAKRPVSMIYWGAVLNFVLFLLNLIPIPGFDGFAVIADFYPRLRHLFTTEKGAAGAFILMVLLFAGVDHLYKLASFCCSFLLSIAGAFL